MQGVMSVEETEAVLSIVVRLTDKRSARQLSAVNGSNGPRLPTSSKTQIHKLLLQTCV